MTDLKKQVDGGFCAEEHAFAVGAVVELADSQLAGLHWEITRKAVTRKRGITTVAYKLRLLRSEHHAVMVNTEPLLFKTLVATQQPPQRTTSCPLTVAAVTIVEDKLTSSCQVELSTVTCWFGGNFHAAVPDAPSTPNSGTSKNSN